MTRNRVGDHTRQSSGVRLKPLEDYARAHNFPFTLSVVEALKQQTSGSLQWLADTLSISKNGLMMILQSKRQEFPRVEQVISIARVLDLDPIISLNQFFFGNEHADLAERMYFSFHAHFVRATEEEMHQVYAIADIYLGLPPYDRALFLGMLDAFQARQQVIPQHEYDLPDTPSEE